MLDRLIGFGSAGVLRQDALAVDDDAAVDRDAIGFLAQWLSGGRRQFGLRAGRPAQPAKLMARLGNPYVLRIGLGDKDLVQSLSNHAPDIGRLFDRRRIGGL